MKTLRGCALALCMLLLALDAMAAITRSGGASATRTGNGNLTLQQDSITVIGDLLIAQIVAQPGATITPPAGWVEITSASADTGSAQQRLYQYWATVSGHGTGSSVSFAIGNSSSKGSAGVIFTLNGLDNTSPFCGASYQSGSATTVTAPALSGCASGSMRMAFFASNSASISLSPNLENSASIDTSSDASAGSGASGIKMSNSYFRMSSSGTGGVQTATTGSNVGNIGATIIITPDPGTTTVTAPYCSSVFSNGVQATGASGNITLSSLSSITGGSATLKTKTLTNNAGATACSGSNCVATGAASTTSAPAFKTGIQVNGAISVSSSGSRDLGVGDFNTVSVGTNATLNFIIEDRIYKTKAISTNSGATIGFAAGDYWVNGDFTLGSSGTLQRITSTGSTRIFVNGNVDLGYRARTSGFTSDQLLIYATGTITGANELAIYGYLYAAGNLTLDYQSVINGAVAGSSFISANNDITLNYQGSNLSTADFMPFCDSSTPPLDHIRFTVTNTPLTCTPAIINVKACADATCSSAYSGSVTTSLTLPTQWSNSSPTLSGSGSTLNFTQTSVATVTLGVSSSTPTATNSPQCYDSVGALASCQVSFVDSGFLFSSIPTQSAGVTSGSLSITAVRKSDNAALCIPAVTGDHSVKLWSGYTSPATGTKSVTISGVTSSAIATASPGTAVTLSFNSSGVANYTLNYPDAGQVSLNATYAGSAGTGDAGLSLAGNSSFVSVPYGLCVDSPDANSTCATADMTCVTHYKKAGETFDLRVTAKSYQAATALCSMPTAPNYQQNGIALSSTVVAPSGGNNGTLGTTSVNITSGGTATISGQTQSEVGVFAFVATPPAASDPTNSYFGQTVPTGTSANIGRFVPFGFTITSPTITPRSALSCSSSFGYLGEGVGLGFTLNAVNSSGATTTNYRGTFARLNLALASGIGAQNGATLLNSRLSTTCSGSSGGVCGTWGNGTAALTAVATVNRSTGTTLDGPYAATKYGLKVTDPDGVTMRLPDYDWDLATAPVANDGLRIGSTDTVLRFGRVRMVNAYGSALLRLPVSTEAQYWNGTAFVLNGNDSCTPLTAPSVVAMSSTSLAAIYCNGGGGMDGSLTGVTASVSATGKMASGKAGLILSKPSGSSSGTMTLALSVPDYLKYNWDGVDQTLPACSAVADGYLHDDNPRARIRFGAKTSNVGNGSIIYRREVY